jgi:hypothetical protein
MDRIGGQARRLEELDALKKKESRGHSKPV